MKVDKSKWEKKLIGECVKEMFLGPFGSSLKRDCFVNKEDSYCMIYEQKHAIQKTLYQDTRYIDKKKFNELSRFVVRPGDFIVSCRGTIGEMYEIPDDAPFGIMHPSIMKIRINESLLNRRFAFLLLNTIIKKQKTDGACVQMAIRASDLSDITISVPPLPEQQAIASELDAIQSLITKYKEQLNDYDNLAKSIFNEMFGDVVSNDKGWERKKLSYMCSEVTSSKRIFAKEYVKEGIPFYRSKEVIERSKGLKPSIELFISTERYNEIKKQYGIPHKNDLLISAVGTIGEIWTVNIDEPFYFKDGNLIWVKSDGVNNSIYLKFLLKILIAEYKKSMPNGAAYAALTINKLQNMTVYAIPLPLQQAFAARITAIESQKDKVKQQIADLQTLFDSRMQYYFD